MKLPSKELVRKVLTEYDKYRDFVIYSDSSHDNMIRISLTGQSQFSCINIYEFAFKVKEFIYNILELDYIDSGIYTNNDYEKYYRCMINKFNEDTYIDEMCLSFEANTEVEAIIKAGEWVLEQIKENK